MSRLGLAIRSGSLISKQITGTLWDGKDGRCALGALALIAGIEVEVGRNFDPEIVSAFPELRRIAGVTPNGFVGKDMHLYDAIWRLNDQANWSREKIADWVDSILDQPAVETDHPSKKEELVQA